MVYAIFRYPNNGLESDIKSAEAQGFVIGEQYIVESIDVGSWISYIQLQGYSGIYNSVQFEFIDEHGKKVDITRWY